VTKEGLRIEEEEELRIEEEEGLRIEEEEGLRIEEEEDSKRDTVEAGECSQKLVTAASGYTAVPLKLPAEGAGRTDDREVEAPVRDC
jgi:hypothetical protein